MMDSADTLICNSGLQLFDNQINVIKTKVLEMLTKLLQYIFDYLSPD